MHCHSRQREEKFTARSLFRLAGSLRHSRAATSPAHALVNSPPLLVQASTWLPQGRGDDHPGSRCGERLRPARIAQGDRVSLGLSRASLGKMPPPGFRAVPRSASDGCLSVPSAVMRAVLGSRAGISRSRLRTNRMTTAEWVMTLFGSPAVAAGCTNSGCIVKLSRGRLFSHKPL